MGWEKHTNLARHQSFMCDRFGPMSKFGPLTIMDSGLKDSTMQLTMAKLAPHEREETRLEIKLHHENCQKQHIPSGSSCLADLKAMMIDLSLPRPPSNELFVFSSAMQQGAGEASSSAGQENVKLLVKTSSSIVLDGNHKANKVGQEIKKDKQNQTIVSIKQALELETSTEEQNGEMQCIHPLEPPIGEVQKEIDQSSSNLQ